MNNNDYLRIGLIVRPHGVKGALKLMPLTCDNERFGALGEAFLEMRGEYKPIQVHDGKCDGEFAYISIDGICDRDSAEALRNVYVCVDRAHVTKLPPGRYFVTDIIGCDIYDTENNYFGHLTDVLETGANDVYEAMNKTDSGTSILRVPALKKLLHEVDIANKRIVLDAVVLQEVGLFEEE